ncbi:Gar1/naf1 RNA-binding region protein [Gregarina niphandrodes]|uniref:H/ACA ribonucleoprotein complex subunit n=1 Tax=Gregarina niphandrodes TaxID=110365 RepID=A0A023B8Y5_GRENI|nr:Gar1/naf1 RNA-binding region protein [Gregarina niphandrodes]EZG70562.1 Gar1/naf1 RNA-binding region protein [Gregarina niphandrodes]|eukprot:XP_011129919.1 Gar1/naf1 RNA-binding region protein [Gregarina niphandrodes]
MFRGGSRGGGFRGGRGGAGNSRGGFGGSGRGGANRNQPMGPPARVIPAGKVLHPCEDQLVVEFSELDKSQVPYFNGRVFLASKTEVGKVDEILGPLTKMLVSVQMAPGVKADSIPAGTVLYIDPTQILPLERFLPAEPGAKPAGRGGARGGGPSRGGRGGGARGRGGPKKGSFSSGRGNFGGSRGSFGGSSRGGSFRSGPPRGGSNRH